MAKTDSKPASDNRRSSADHADHNDHHHGHGDGHGGYAAGMDLPVFGHIAYKSLGFWAGLGVAGAVGVIEWPVVAAVGVGYALARR
jgi:hypothetical protein